MCVGNQVHPFVRTSESGKTNAQQGDTEVRDSVHGFEAVAGELPPSTLSSGWAAGTLSVFHRSNSAPKPYCLFRASRSWTPTCAQGPDGLLRAPCAPRAQRTRSSRPGYWRSLRLRKFRGDVFSIGAWASYGRTVLPTVLRRPCESTGCAVIVERATENRGGFRGIQASAPHGGARSAAKRCA